MFDTAAQQLQQPGTVGVLPTDTLYGVVARAQDMAAVARLYRLRQRVHKPGPIIAAGIDQLVELGLKRRYLMPFEQFWPGPVSAVVPCGPELECLHQGTYTLAVRIPAYRALRELLAKTGPLMTTSANRPGEPASVTVDEAKTYFGSRVDFYVDGGDYTGRAPSTVIRMLDDAIEVLREGAVKINEKGEIAAP